MRLLHIFSKKHLANQGLEFKFKALVWQVMGAFSKNIAFFVMGFIAATAEADLTDASCLETAHDNDVPELMKVQLLQSDLSVRRAKARAARKEAEAGSSQDGAVLDAKVDQITGRVEMEQLDAKVEVTEKVEEVEEQLDTKVKQITDKVEVKTPVLSALNFHDASVAPQLKKAAVLSLFRVVDTMDVFNLKKQFPSPEPSGDEPTRIDWGWGTSVSIGGDSNVSIGGDSNEGSPGLLWWDRDRTSLQFESVGDMVKWFCLVTLIDLAILFGITFVVAAVYRACKTEVVASGQPGQTAVSGDWSHGLFDCFGALDICLVSCFCPGIRWSETMSYVPALACCGCSGFWGWLILYMIFLSISFVSCGCPAILFLFAERRDALRNRAGIQGSCCMDCLSYLFCFPCTLTQDAREVEDAVRKQSQWLVGAPVGAPSGLQ